jgi:SDR family mycofactocin-dependent oxidoreductase
MGGQFEGKVALITGAARGQGRAHALRLARDGADIVGIDLCAQIGTVAYPMATKDDLDETIELVGQRGARMIGLVGDVRDRDFLDGAYDEGQRSFGRIDFVVANAGIMPIWGDGSDTMQAWQDCLDVLLTGVLNTIEAGWPRMVKQGTGGSIVITGSMAGVVPTMRTLAGRTLGLLGYSAAKAALVNLMENYASMLAYHHIRVNTVHPTGVSTPMIENDMARDRFATAHEEDLKCIVNAIPVNAVEADDIANAVAWLCSDESRYFTGSAMRIDAGASLR